ncbi:hypothetical protein DFR70_1011182 [Nocardia tenerifensis]|uniref:Immunity protein 49 of polymorphic toxin system n=1 Tax=Nocardia tenerifensis TaxID=228006 RepID=A0A318KBQ6_9NOCA|nr:hypothetical protein [Nocardia tenerifensis]PXX71748.1 hypothetical protein DFR70_1011182 [Nocardia tenerifensis]
MSAAPPSPAESATLSSLFEEVDRAAGAVSRVGAAGLPSLTAALWDYLERLAAEDTAMTHPHVRPAVTTLANTTSAYFGARLRHTSDQARCEIPLLRMTVTTGRDEELGPPSIHEWLESFELALISRNGPRDFYLRSQFSLMYHPRLWTPDDPAETRVPHAYAAALSALLQRARWPRNKNVKAAVAELLPSALERLAAAPQDPRVRIVEHLAAKKDITPVLTDALAQPTPTRIAWPLLALAALAHDLKRPARLETDCLPRSLVAWQS